MGFVSSSIGDVGRKVLVMITDGGVVSEETALKLGLLARGQGCEEARMRILGSHMCSPMHSLRASSLGVGTRDNGLTYL